MDLSPGMVIVIAVVAVAVTSMLIRWGRRHEAPSPEESRVTPARPGSSNAMSPREERDTHSLVDWLLDRAFDQTGIRVDNDPLARERIAQAAKQAMEDLRTGGSATISLPFLVADARGPKHFNVEVKRKGDSTFELQR